MWAWFTREKGYRMKRNWFDRILLALVLLVMAILSVAMILLACGVFPVLQVQNVFQNLLTSSTYVLVLGIVGGILLLMVLRLMFAGKDKKEIQPTSTLIKATEFGASYITLSAIDSMVQKHCRTNNRIRQTVSSVLGVRDGGILIRVRLSLMPDTDIPELTLALQQSLKEYIEKLSGIAVREVHILVEDTSINPKSRVD